MRTIDLVKSPKQVLRSSINVISTRVVWEVISQRRSIQLLFKQIDLVQEEDDARAHEPPRVDDRVEEHQRFHHAVLITLFQQHLVVLAQCDAEYDGCDVLEAVNPLLSFTALSADIEHVYAELSHLEPCFVDTGGLRSCPQHVGFCGDEVLCSYPGSFVEKTSWQVRTDFTCSH